MSQAFLRPHQAAFAELVRTAPLEEIDGTVGAITPGGGKSLCPIIGLAALRARGLVDKIAWVVPRLNLASQAEDTFADDLWRGLLEHDLEIRQNDNEPNPTKGTDGYVTTYQSIVANPDLHAAEMRKHRYFLVLDEFHHLEEGGDWHNAIAPVVENAAATFLMSGSLERGDGRRIAYLPYEQDPDSKDLYHLKDPERMISYTRAQALADRNILPLAFMHLDGQVSIIEEGEDAVTTEISRGRDGNTLRLALSSNYAFGLLGRCVEDFSRWRLEKSVTSRMLVVAHDIKRAREYTDWLKERQLRAAIATSDNQKVALRNIDALKQGTIDILVTVGMAYEGLDVPEISHIACLTLYRTFPWVDQMLNRATRRNPNIPYDGQMGRIFCPDDPALAAIIQQLVEEQEIIARGRQSGDSAPAEKSDIEGGEGAEQKEGPTVESSATSARRSKLDEQGLLFDDERAARVEFKPRKANRQPVRATERITQLRKQIQGMSLRLDQIRKARPGSTNKLLVKRYKKHRDAMTEDELQRVAKHLGSLLHDHAPAASSAGGRS